MVQAKRDKTVKAEWGLLALAQNGDKAACRKLFDSYQGRLYSLAYLITGIAAEAEDIVQETFVRALHAKITHHRGTPQGFLGTIAYRLAVKEKRRREKIAEINSEEIFDNTVDTFEKMLLDERDRLIATTIRSLDDKHRDVLVLRFYADHSYEEIAELLQVSPGTVKSRIFYAVKSCRKILREKGLTS